MSKLTLHKSELLVEILESDTMSGLIMIDVEGKTRLSLRVKDGVLIINADYSANRTQPTYIEVNQETVKIER